MEADIRGQFRSREREKRYKLKIAEQARRIRTFQAAMSVFIYDKANNNGSEPDDVSIKSEDSDADQTDSEKGTELVDNRDDEEPRESSDREEPLWDSFDGVHRCAECLYEVPCGICSKCGKVYSMDIDNLEDDRSRSVVTDHASLNPDRRLAPRGDTPLREVLDHANLLDAYADRREEYRALLQRGATRAMCEQFELEFSDKKGIVAWADGDLFDAFSGPGMQEGDHWKIYLGRCIKLDEDDLDGSEFIENLLEEVLLFPLHVRKEPHRSEKWITTEESPGIWATRPAVAKETDAHKTTRRVDRAASEFVDEDEYDTDMAEGDAGYTTDLECDSVKSWDPLYAATEGIRDDDGQDDDADEADDEEDEEEEEEREETNPTISREVYETDGEDHEELDELQDDSDQEEEVLPLHVAWDAFTPDAEYDSEADEGFKSDESSPGSDFDSQEELSGDEVIIRK